MQTRNVKAHRFSRSGLTAGMLRDFLNDLDEDDLDRQVIFEAIGVDFWVDTVQVRHTYPANPKKTDTSFLRLSVGEVYG